MRVGDKRALGLRLRRAQGKLQLVLHLHPIHRLISLGAIASTLFACSSKSTDANSSEGNQDLSDVVYVGGTTDEALLRLLDLPVKDSAAERVVLDAPDVSQALSKDEPATLTFHSASHASITPGARERSVHAAAEKGFAASAVAELLRLFGPERSAFAHGAAYNGQAFWLVVSDTSGKAKLRVFTAQTSYTVEADAWSRLAASAQPLSLSITSAWFEDNEIPQDGGPFVGGTFPLDIR